MNDANVAAGTEFFVTAASLQSNESLTFNGAAETNGRFTVHGGGGADTITGGAGGDFFLGNAGNDTLYGLGGIDFLIGGLGADQLRGGAGARPVRLPVAPPSRRPAASTRSSTSSMSTGSTSSAIDANGNAGDGNSAFTFIGAERLRQRRRRASRLPVGRRLVRRGRRQRRRRSPTWSSRSPCPMRRRSGRATSSSRRGFAVIDANRDGRRQPARSYLFVSLASRSGCPVRIRTSIDGVQSP